MGDRFEFITTVEAPADDAAAITPNDSSDLVSVARALWVGTLGNVKVTTKAGTVVTFTGVSGLLPIRAKRVWATDTTATGIVAMY